MTTSRSQNQEASLYFRGFCPLTTFLHVLGEEETGPVSEVKLVLRTMVCADGKSPAPWSQFSVRIRRAPLSSPFLKHAYRHTTAQSRQPLDYLVLVFKNEILKCPFLE
jgi:hypothetical protein